MKSLFKPCPFCGSDKVAGAHSFVNVYMIKCLDCGAITSFYGEEDEVKAIDAWNKREQRGKETE